MKLVILGAPGAGKGTQSRNIAEHYNIKHISTGDILRNEMANKTPIGIEIFEDMNKGILVPDELITNLLFEKIANLDDFILDGYPRTIEQAKTLDRYIDINKVISVEVPFDEIVNRMEARVVCANCGEVYNLNYKPPENPQICDKCHASLTKRSDDNEKTVLDRLQIYKNLIDPIKDFYEEKNKLITVSGLDDVNVITTNIINKL